MLTKILLLLGCAGHLLCAACDIMLGVTPYGRFSFEIANDKEEMNKFFEKANPKVLVAGTILGAIALSIAFGGYYEICKWMQSFSNVYAAIMLSSLPLFLIIGAVHHVLIGILEFIYVKMDRTNKAYELVMDSFKKQVLQWHFVTLE